MTPFRLLIFISGFHYIDYSPSYLKDSLFYFFVGLVLFILPLLLQAIASPFHFFQSLALSANVALFLVLGFFDFLPFAIHSSVTPL